MAAGDSQRCIANAAFRAIVPIRDTSGALVSGATSLDSELSLDSNTPSDLTAEATEIGSSGVYYVDITAAEFAATGDATLTVASAEGVTSVLHLPIEPASDSGVAQAGTATSITLATTASATNDYYNGQVVEIVRGTGAGQFRTIVDYVGTTTVATVERAWATNPDTTSVYKVWKLGARMNVDAYQEVDVQEVDADATVPAAMVFAYQGGFIQSSVDDATPTTTSFIGASGLSTTNDFYNQSLLLFVTGNNAGIPREITDYVGSTLTFTTTAFPVAPANGDSFMIVGVVA